MKRKLILTLLALVLTLPFYTANAQRKLSGETPVSNNPSNRADNGDIIQLTDYVDLGLPSKTLWASKNLGANSPEQFGDYLAWGEIYPKQSYSWDNYFDVRSNNGEDVTFYKFKEDGKTSLCGTECDAATVRLGAGWSYPSDAQKNELLTECTWSWTNFRGVYGASVKGPNGNCIFIPAAGTYFLTVKKGKEPAQVGEAVFLWSGDLVPNGFSSERALAIIKRDGYPTYYDRNGDRCDGKSVRPVYNPNSTRPVTQAKTMSAAECKAMYDRAYALHYKDGATKDEEKQANDMFIQLAQQAYEPAYAYAALAYKTNQDLENYEFFGKKSIDSTYDNWFGYTFGKYCDEHKMYDLAFKCYMKATNSNRSDDAWFEVGKMYETGVGVTKDIEKAKDAYRKSALANKIGDPKYSDGYRAFARLGGTSLFERQYYVDIDPREVLNMTPEEMLRKGENYMEGFAVSKMDPYKGWGYIKAAAEAGNIKAMQKLAEICLNPVYGIDDPDMAQNYYKMAFDKYMQLANQGDATGVFEVANCYKYGRGVPKDLDKAAEYYKRGAEMGHMYCMRYYADSLKSQGKNDMAFSYYLKAANKGDGMAMYAVGCMYRDGVGTSVDIDKAVEWLRKAANSPYACAHEAEWDLNRLGYSK